MGAEAKKKRGLWVWLLLLLLLLLLGAVVTWQFIGRPSAGQASPSASPTFSSVQEATPSASSQAEPTTEEPASPSPSPSPSSDSRPSDLGMVLGTDHVTLGDLDFHMPSGITLTEIDVTDPQVARLIMTDEFSSLAYTFVHGHPPITDTQQACAQLAQEAANQLRDATVSPQLEDLSSADVSVTVCAGTGTADTEEAFTWYVFSSPTHPPVLLESRVSTKDLEVDGTNISRMNDFVACQVGRDLGALLPMCGP